VQSLFHISPFGCRATHTRGQAFQCEAPESCAAGCRVARDRCKRDLLRRKVHEEAITQVLTHAPHRVYINVDLHTGKLHELSTTYFST
jgi:hypothetical protein